MTKIDPIIAVKDVDSSAKWYGDIFGFKNSSPKGHGFAVLKSETNEIVSLPSSMGNGQPSNDDRPKY